MKQSIKAFLLMAAIVCAGGFAGCSDGNDNPEDPDVPDVPEVPEEPDTPDNPGDDVTAVFAKGADVSWVTEMEDKGVKFYNSDGVETECMALLKDLGCNAIRLRVWVNPANGWNGTQDVLTKALRAKALDLRLMIDFHYSDTWADPSHQTKPAAWADYNIEELKTALANHTRSVLQTLKDNGVDVEWVQVGNEVSWGMLWPTGQINNDNFTVFTQLVNSGYDAVKDVYSDAKVVVHCNNGYNLDLFTWLFDGLRAAGGKWDVIGMSLYPEAAGNLSWQTATTNCLNNIATLASRYDKDVMVCEIGAPWDSQNAEAIMQKMAGGCEDADRCLGIFYWEPEAYNGWNGYTLGAFDNSGRPTDALKAFFGE